MRHCQKMMSKARSCYFMAWRNIFVESKSTCLLYNFVMWVSYQTTFLPKHTSMQKKKKIDLCLLQGAKQAPAIIVANDGTKSLQSATLIFDGSILTTLRSPSAFDSIAFPMAGYWVYHINYPAPYWQHMECIEAILHGKNCRKSF